MATFKQLHLVLTIKDSKKNKSVQIYKYQKENTKSFFFAPSFEGKRISKTLFARLYDAKDLASKFLTNQ